jgi:hypothetical protein
MLNPVYCLDYACFFHAARRRQVWLVWGKVLSQAAQILSARDYDEIHKI